MPQTSMTVITTVGRLRWFQTVLKTILKTLLQQGSKVWSTVLYWFVYGVGGKSLEQQVLWFS